MSTATIDTGRMDMPLHVKSAGLFFIFNIIACLSNTILCYFIYKETKKVATVSIAVKIILSILLIYQLYLQLTKASGFMQRDKSDLSHIL
jgi:hypothetical protein